MSESDKFNLLGVKKFKNALSVWEIRQQSIFSEDIVLTVIIKAKQAASTHQISCRYVALLNVFLATKYSAKIKKGCSRLEGRLPHTCGEVNNTF